MPSGGKRSGAGRKSKHIRDLQRAGAAAVLTDAVESEKLIKLLDSDDEKIVPDVAKFLYDHKHGKAKQSLNTRAIWG
ncbi:MAG TPA: hypothetical protein VGD64_03385 [Acidisarcina sp.]